jgi:hypothetical protein
MRWTADETVSAIIQQKLSELEPAGSGAQGVPSALVGSQADGIALIDLIEPTSTTDASKIQIDRRSRKVAERFAADIERRITKLLSDPKGFPDGKGKRTKLTPPREQRLRSGLAEALEYASLFAGPLPNRAQGRGRPPDNAVLIFIDDIDRACRAADLKPGLRYVAPVSLPVAIFIELAPLIWPGHPKNPRKLFERWKRHQPTLVRE